MREPVAETERPVEAHAPVRGRGGLPGERAVIARVVVQLVLVLAVIHTFQLESRTFFHVMVLATAGFAVHALLPLGYRPGFFAALSLGSVIVAFGLFDGACLIGLGLVLLGICHLHLPIRMRVALLAAVGGLYAAWRAELLPAPWSGAVWPILASMFMFRIALYLHGLSHDRTPPSLARALGYFFMLPNVCFPLYPVVDYAAFARNYYDRDTARIYETGVSWIVRGLVHLLLYRFVYQHLASGPEQLRSLGDFVQFLLATFLLYLRVSGQFHLITGMLHLFGFRLPATHHLYYLASSFTDFWRRINIYWKDFMMKLVYYPSYFALRQRGDTVALVGATLVVFVSTWLLHSYQWFWLRGGFPVEAQDGLFWGALGVLVIVGSLREMKTSRKRVLGSTQPRWSLALALRTVGTFTAICVLWSLWSADSVSEWVVMWMVAGQPAPGDLWLLAGLLAGGILIAGRDWSNRESYDATARAIHREPAVRSVVTLLVLLVIARADLYVGHAPGFAAAIAALRADTLNARDAALQHKGYYEKLDNQSRMSAQLWKIEVQKPAHWVGLTETAASRRRADFMIGDLVPGAKITFMDQPFCVNRWGMRDVEMTREKPPGTIRIAILGPSHVMGSGVADGETFADVLETLLNEGGTGGPRYEVLNFGRAGCSILYQLGMLEERVLGFDPDMVIFTDSPRMDDALVEQVYDSLTRGKIPYPEIQALVDVAGAAEMHAPGIPVPFAHLRSVFGALGVATRMPSREARLRVRLAVEPLAKKTLRRIAATTRARGIFPVFLALDNVAEPPRVAMRAIADATASGFVVFNLLDTWVGVDPGAYRIAGWDAHPNVAGHRRIATRLCALIEQHRAALGLDAPAVGTLSTSIAE